MIKINDHVIELANFPNKERYVTVHGIETIKEQVLGTKVSEDIVISAKFVDNNTIFDIIIVKSIVNELIKEYKGSEIYGNNINLVLPYLPYSRMDRKVNDNPFTLKYFVQTLLPFNFNKIETYNVHNLERTKKLFNDDKTEFVNHNNSLDLILKSLSINNEDLNDENLFDDKLFIFPDASSYLRLSNISSRESKIIFKNFIIVKKDRDFQTGRINGVKVDKLISNKLGNNEIKEIIFIDDIISYGGTVSKSLALIENDEYVLERFTFTKDCEKTLCICHTEKALLETELLNEFDKFVTTNSIVDEKSIKEKLINLNNTKTKVKVIDVI